MDEYFFKTLMIIILGSSYYLYRLYKMPNCLMRVDSNNVKRLCLGSIPAGLIGPIKSVYLALKYQGISNAIYVFKELFLSKDNPILIFLVLSSFTFLI